MACKHCSESIYVKRIQYLRPMLAPLTHVGELRDELEDLTGEVYLLLPHRYCPVCGDKLQAEEADENA